MNIELSFFRRNTRTLKWLSCTSIYIYSSLRSAKAQRHRGDAATTAHAYPTSYANCAQHTSSLACWFCYLKSNKPPPFLCCSNHICNKILQQHKERCTKPQAEFTFSSTALNEAGGWLPSPGRTFGACWKSLCTGDREGWQEAGALRVVPADRRAPVPRQQMSFCICPGNWSHCLGFFFYALA